MVNHDVTGVASLWGLFIDLTPRRLFEGMGLLKVKWDRLINLLYKTGIFMMVCSRLIPTEMRLIGQEVSSSSLSRYWRA